MTILTAVALAVAIGTLVAAVVLGRRSAASLATERTRAADLQAKLEQTTAERQELQSAAAAAETRATDAETRAAEAASDTARAAKRADESDRAAKRAEAQAKVEADKAEHSKQRLAEIEKRLAESEQRHGRSARTAAQPRPEQTPAQQAHGEAAGSEAGNSEPGDAESSGTGDAESSGTSPRSHTRGLPASAAADLHAALWNLERVRLEREWREIAGEPASLPVPWDGTVGAALAVELELIREVVGTPSQLDRSAGGPVDPAVAATTCRLAGELLRTLARTGEELVVTVTGPAEVRVAVAADPATPRPDTTALRGLADAAGATVEISDEPGGWQATVMVPAGVTVRPAAGS